MIVTDVEFPLNSLHLRSLFWASVDQKKMGSCDRRIALKKALSSLYKEIANKAGNEDSDSDEGIKSDLSELGEASEAGAGEASEASEVKEASCAFVRWQQVCQSGW